MKILLFGKNGQLGWELQRSLAPLGELLALSTNSTNYCGDFTNLEGIGKTVADFAPDIIVNAAAYTAVDKAETEPELAHLVNAAAPQVLAQEALRLGAWLIHYSTDYVFDGSGQQFWSENDTPNPLSIYGKTKLAGEQAIKQTGCTHLIFRTSWVYAARGGNFAKTMLRLAKERTSLNVIADQFGAPTGADLLADVTALCLKQIQDSPNTSANLTGIYHLVAAGVTTWFDYASFVIESARQQSASITVAPQDIKPIPTSAYPLPAPRPSNSRLNTQHLQNTFNLKLPEWQIGVHRMLQEMKITK